MLNPTFQRYVRCVPWGLATAWLLNEKFVDAHATAGFFADFPPPANVIIRTFGSHSAH